MAKYLIGRGTLKIAPRGTDGYPLAFRDVGECPVIEVVPNVTYVDNFETASVAGKQDLHVPTRKALTMNVTMKEITSKNLGILLGGDVVTIAGGAASNLPWPTGIAAGEERRLPDLSFNVTSLVITDNAAGTLVAGTHYTANLKTGTVKFINLASFVQPFKASFTRVASESVTALTSAQSEWHILAEIFNIAEAGKAYLFEAFRAVIDQPQNVSLKGEDVNMFQTVVTVLNDDTKPSTGTPLGQYARWAQAEA
jgi:hypothetical protein